MLEYAYFPVSWSGLISVDMLIYFNDEPCPGGDARKPEVVWRQEARSHHSKHNLRSRIVVSLWVGSNRDLGCSHLSKVLVRGSSVRVGFYI